MSTTFGIFIAGEIIRDSNAEPTFDDIPFMDKVEIARRVGGPNGAEMHFTNELAHLLPADTKVVALDNSAQGIFTIGDIIEHIKNQKLNSDLV
tara:strand:+ start:7813 stop:8091 length:279 start_codon:yes stop_codon:yes gene_type:complete